MLVLLVCVCFVDVACMVVMIGLVGGIVGILVLGVSVVVGGVVLVRVFVLVLLE